MYSFGVLRAITNLFIPACRAISYTSGMLLASAVKRISNSGALIKSSLAAEGDSVCANTVLETGELRIRVTDNQINSRILQLINLIIEDRKSVV